MPPGFGSGETSRFPFARLRALAHRGWGIFTLRGAGRNRHGRFSRERESTPRDVPPAGLLPCRLRTCGEPGPAGGTRSLRPAEQGLKLGWDTVRQDLSVLAQTEVREGDRWYVLRSPLQGTAGKVLQAAGIAIPPPVRPASSVVPGN